ncbi:hypothetical protein GGI43DRAFT_88271 [Trichoderma evansii]
MMSRAPDMRDESNSRLAGGGHFERGPWAASHAALHEMEMEMVAFRSTVDAKGGRGSRTQPQLFDRGSLMLRLLAEAIMPEAGKAAVNDMLEEKEGK